MAATYFAVLPSPRQISSPNLRQLALTTLQVLDTDKSLTNTVFQPSSDQAWTDLEIALSASLPPNVVYNLTVYDMVKSGDTVVYQPFHSITNSESGLGTDSEASTYLVTSVNVTFSITPQRISGTLYILNCSDANGWWITGYTGQSLAGDLYTLLSPYFNTTVMVQNTVDLGRLLNGTKISGSPHEKVENAVIINTFGEAVPIPAGYYTTDGYADGSYARYAWRLGQRSNFHNWTWVSIVGYPFYYVTNTVTFSSTHNSWGIYGMRQISGYGLGCFLRGLDGQSYSYVSQSTGNPGVVYFSSDAHYYSNYYGIYPSPYQTATRALPSSIHSTYPHLTFVSSVFNPKNNYYGAATVKHTEGGIQKGALTAIGLTRTPDIRVTALALLMYYHPTIYKSEFTLGADEQATQRLVVLHLSQQGGS